jgi:hypothetical protein
MTPFLFMTPELIDHWTNVKLEVNDPGKHSVSITRKVLPTTYYMHKALGCVLAINLISIYYNHITHKSNATRNGCLTHNSDMYTDQHYLFYDLWEEERPEGTKFKRKTHCDNRRIKGHWPCYVGMHFLAFPSSDKTW